MGTYDDWAKRKAGKRFAGSTGEGSRGGKVIGHTKSGKPIYAPSEKVSGMAGVERHVAGHTGGYSRQDHKDAATALLRYRVKVERGAYQKQPLLTGRSRDKMYEHGINLRSAAGLHKRLAKNAE